MPAHGLNNDEFLHQIRTAARPLVLGLRRSRAPGSHLPTAPPLPTEGEGLTGTGVPVAAPVLAGSEDGGVPVAQALVVDPTDAGETAMVTHSAHHASI